MYEMQLQFTDEDGVKEWKSIRCTGAKWPYRFKTIDEAWESLSSWYPDAEDEIKRIIHIGSGRVVDHQRHIWSQQDDVLRASFGHEIVNNSYKQDEIERSKNGR